MTPRHRTAAAIVALAMTAAACTVEFRVGDPSPPPPSVPPPASPPDGVGLRVEPVDTGEATSAGAMEALCVEPTPTSTGDGSSPGPTPPAIAEVQDQVEAVRGLGFLEPVDAEPVDADEIAADLNAAFDEANPKDFYDRRTVAWQTIGVIPTDVTIRGALRAYQQGQVVGFYNPVDGQLVYVGDDELDLTERYILAHELTHAIDDQNFDLTRLDDIAARCHDEALLAGLGAVEGDAQFFASRVLQEFPDPDAGLGDGGGGGLPEGVPPFILQLQAWPYTGHAFIGALEQRGGLDAIDEALRTLPTSTEQVLHPERYPSDQPTPVNVADLSKSLGDGWGDLDVMEIGEVWLVAMLSLGLDDDDLVRGATAGWDGGLYRSWTDGEDAAVLLSTVWDTPADAAQFADAVRSWMGSMGRAGFVHDPTGVRVTAGFATSKQALTSLERSTRD